MRLPRTCFLWSPVLWCLEARLVKQLLSYIIFRTADSLSMSLTVDWNLSMKLNQIVKSTLKLGRFICGNLAVIVVRSICAVAKQLMSWDDAAIFLFASSRVWRAAFCVSWHWSNTWSYSESSKIASSSSWSAFEDWVKQCSSSVFYRSTRLGCDTIENNTKVANLRNLPFQNS